MRSPRLDALGGLGHRLDRWLIARGKGHAVVHEHHGHA